MFDLLLSLVRVGPEFHPDSLTFERQAAPAVAADPDGNFVVAWTNERSYGDGYGIYAQRYDAARAARGAPFQVSTIGGQGNPAVAIDADGDFVITWDDAHNIRARRYNASGVQLVGNVSPLSAGQCDSRYTWSHNVWDGAKCGTTDKNAPDGFVNAATGDLHLTAGSAAIDAGDPASYPAVDAEGRARPRGAAPDAGAYEF